MTGRHETCDGWFLEERTPGRLWHVTRDAWDEDENLARQVYYADIQLDPRLSCEHRQWYLVRWTPTPDDVMKISTTPDNWPYPATTVFTLDGRFDSVNSAVSAVVTMNHYQYMANQWLDRRKPVV